LPEALQTPTTAVRFGFQSLLCLANTVCWLAVQGAAALVGLGFGAYLGVDIALITQVLPSASTRGKDLGVIFAHCPRASSHGQ
jgi:hypothetical protein